MIAQKSLDKDWPSPKYALSTMHTTHERFSFLPYLEFGQSQVPNLFRKTPEFFLLEFKDEGMIAIGAFKREYFPMFTATAVSEPVSLNGMEYSQAISITHPDQEFKILLPAESSYDPAGRKGSSVDTEVITPLQHAFLLMFSCVQVNAALSGLSEEALDTILATFQDFLAIVVGKRCVVEWVHAQVKFACFYKEPPPSYWKFLLNEVISQNLALDLTRLHTKEYLEYMLANKPFQRENETPTFLDPIKLAKRGVMRYLSCLNPQIDQLVEKGRHINDLSLISLRLHREYLDTKSTNCLIF